MMESLERLEAKRKKSCKILIGTYAVCGLLSFFLFVFNISLGVIFFVLLIFVVGVLGLDKVKEDYIQDYKRTLIEAELSKVFDDVQIDFEQGFSEEEIERWCLVDCHDRFYSDDMISGSLLGKHFVRSDVKIQDVRTSGKTTTVVTTFEGPWIVIDFDKRFKHYTVVKEKEFLDNGKPGGWYSGKKVDKIELEDIRFNRKFVVFSEDGQEAFYLLTPPVMEKIMELEQRVEGRLYLGFIEGKLHIALDNNQNAFEPSLFEPVNDEALERSKAEIAWIKELVMLVDELD